MGSGRSRGVAVALSALVVAVAAVAPTVIAPVVAAAAEPQEPQEPVIRVASAELTVPATPSASATAVTSCPAGSRLLSGGALASGTDATAASGLRAKATFPSHANGTRIEDSTGEIPEYWAAVGDVTGPPGDGGKVSSFAVCVEEARLLGQLSVVARLAVGPTQAGAVQVTAPCPGGTVAVGGGGLMASGGSLAGMTTVSSFPSDAQGNPLPDGAADPRYWTAVVVGSGAAPTTTRTIASVMCAKPADMDVRVVRKDGLGPQAGNGQVTYTASCPADLALLGGGQHLSRGAGGAYAPDAYLRGSYPSDQAGVPAGNGSTGPSSWSSTIVAGASGGTGDQVASTFALCGDFDHDTTTSLATNITSPLFGRPVELTASVLPALRDVGTPTGTVTFSDATRPLATVPLNAEGKAVFRTPSLQPGTHSITASYGGGPTFHPSSTAPTTITVSFSEPCLTTVHKSTMTVRPEQALCIGPGGLQKGPVNVEPGGALAVTSGEIAGTVSSSGASAFTLCQSTVGGPVTVQGSTGLVLIGSDDLPCAGNTIKGSLTVTGNTGGVQVIGNTTNGPLTVEGNSDPGPGPTDPQDPQDPQEPQEPRDPREPVIHVATTDLPVPPASSAFATAVTACPEGSVLVSGGLWGSKVDATDPVPPINGLRAKGSFPSDASGTMSSTGTQNPQFWAAVGNFGGQAEEGDKITSFAVCAQGTQLDHRVVSVASAPGPLRAGNVLVTAACPEGTVVVGGGSHTLPPEAATLKAVGSFPSDAQGNPLPNGALNPRYWTGMGVANGRFDVPPQTFAYAVCAEPGEMDVQVVRTERLGPQEGSSYAITTATCPTGRTLIGGGVHLLQGPTSGPVTGGTHLRGSYPSDALGDPAVNGATNPASWSAVIAAGGSSGTGDAPALGFALCADFDHESATSLAASTPSPLFGRAVELTASVQPVVPDAGSPTGAVSFSDGETLLAVVPVTAGQAVLRTTSLQPGAHQITARYSGGPTFKPSTTTAPTTITVGFSQPCITAVHKAAVTVTADQSLCIGPGGQQKGPVTVNPGGALAVTGGEIAGALSVNQAAAFTLCQSSVSGSVTVQSGTGLVLIGSDYLPCAGNAINGTVTVSANTGGLSVSGTTISGPLTVRDNSGDGPDPGDPVPAITANRIGGGLSCTGNIPTVREQGNTVNGVRSGQCR
ncbi:Ig-like domain-containing protein [Frankia sp. R43]|uniref:Ig-like domain-containing protein n=1 Tax=Frankia sp. R43 TaxID=269536 RepID=UPI000A6C24E6|nr:Ig-like domain-containing protein [Frankia sp. R43]